MRKTTMHAGRALTLAAMLLTPLALSGCGEAGFAGALRSSGVAGTPDEFMVLPTRPLEMPESLTALPPPTPGAVNRVDYRPHTEAVTGLTGRPTVQGSGGGGLVAAAGPRDPAVRTQLAQEDVVWRQTHHGRFFERLFSTDREALVYRPMVLDAPVAFDQQRAQGRQVPAAPPAVLGQ
jgi:hypothetical protein